MAAIGFGKGFGVEHVAAAGDLGCQSQPHLVRQGVGAVDPLHFFQRLFPAFRPLDGFFPVESLQGTDDFLLPADLPLLHIVSFLLDFPVDCLLGHIKSIIAVVYGGFFVFDLHDLGNDFIQEVPVMGDDEDRAVIGL